MTRGQVDVGGPPADVARLYRDKGYWRGQTLGEALHEWSTPRPDAPALLHGDNQMTYAELDATVDRVAYGLLKLGLNEGDRVVLHLPNTLEFVILAFAMMRIGVVAVFALPDHREHELSHFVATAQACGYVIPASYRGFDEQALAKRLTQTHPDLRHVIVVGDDVQDGFTPYSDLIAHDLDPTQARDAVKAHRPDPDDVAFFLLSGGTTGLPKLIPRTHNDYVYNVTASAELCQMNTDTVYLAALPVAHNFPWGCPGLLGALSAGGKAVLTQNPSPVESFPLIASEGVTMTALVPALAIRWMDAVADAGSQTDHDLSSLRVLQVGGAKLNPEAARRVCPTLGATLQQVFGMAEGLLNYTRLDDPDEVIVNTQGRPLSPDDQVRVVDSDGNPVPDGQSGRLETRGPYTISGYHNAGTANAESFTAEGFYRSSDVVRRDAAGNLTVEGRVADFINRGGEKFSAEEVENHILAHPAVTNVAVVGMPDREMNERGCAYIVLRPDQTVDLDSLRTFLTDRGLARFKIPDRLEAVTDLPMTKVGKVSKVALREDISKKLADEGVL